MKLSKRAAIAGTAAMAAVLLAGCEAQQWRDLENQTQTEPDKVRLITNVDGYPNVVALCIEGVGFATTTRDSLGAIQRVPEWNEGWCAE